jgi:outer membrane receptor protein involved in Fe transport
MRIPSVCSVLLGTSALGLVCGDIGSAQTELPEIVVRQPKPAVKPAPKPRTAAGRQAPAPVRAAHAPARRPSPPPPAPPPPSPAQVVSEKNQSFDQARDSNILPKIGTNSSEMTEKAIEALPQGTETPIEKVLLQMPGVTQDSAASGSLHVRNEHANLQYRINGIMLPEGVIGFSQMLETGFFGKLELVTGALPAQYGLHTAGLIDLTTKSSAFSGRGNISIYGGSHDWLTPRFEYGNTIGQTQYFVTGRFLTNNLGIENPTPSYEAIHDRTYQEKFFGYVSTLLNDTTRLSIISGIAETSYQIPNRPGQPPVFTDFVGVTPSSLNSALLNENQFETNAYNVVALQKKVDDLDLQLAYFDRYARVHYVPDPIGDIVFNGVATNVLRTSFLNGLQGDGAYRVNPVNTVRAGFYISGEQSLVRDMALVLPGCAADTPPCPGPSPFGVLDATPFFGVLAGTYVQDEWKITDRLTLNFGLRFDQMYQFIDANQFSPRASLTYLPWEGATFHAAYARYFTPPLQVIATPTNLALFQNTTAAPAVNQESPVLPERSHVFDVGIDQKIVPGLLIGVDAYYKIARDLLDDGQFGQAYVLDGFNYAKGINKGIEFKAKYENGGFQAYGNLAWAVQKGTEIVSNQFLFDPDELAYIATHWVFTDHCQILTGSAGISYLWQGTRVSADMIYGSGLRSGFANTSHLPPYTQVNVGISRDFVLAPGEKPFTLRFDVVNVFDEIYEIRNGTGIGVFAPQFGPRRGYFVGLSKKF